MLMIMYQLTLQYSHGSTSHTDEWNFGSEEQMLEAVAEIAGLLNSKPEFKSQRIEPTDPQYRRE